MKMKLVVVLTIRHRLTTGITDPEVGAHILMGGKGSP